jgi:hypothetical protein
MRTMLLIASLLVAISPLQSISQNKTDHKSSETLDAITSAFDYSARNGRSINGEIVVAERIRKYIVVSVIAQCSWKRLCKDGSRRLVYDPSLKRIIYAEADG